MGYLNKSDKLLFIMTIILRRYRKRFCAEVNRTTDEIRYLTKYRSLIKFEIDILVGVSDTFVVYISYLNPKNFRIKECYLNSQHDNSFYDLKIPSSNFYNLLSHKHSLPV